MWKPLLLAAVLAGTACSSDNPAPTGNDGPGTDDPTDDPTDQPAAKQYVFVSTGSGNAVAQFIVGSNGALTPNNPPTVAAGQYPAMVLADPQGRYVFVKNANDGTMNAYTVGANGTLSPNGTVPNLGIGGYAGISPNGAFVYATTYGPMVHQLRVGADGTLQANTPASATITGNTTGMAFTANGAFAYVTAFNSNVVNQVSVSASGQLTALDPATVAVAENPRQIAVTPNGQYAYAVSSSGNTVSLFRVGANGTLTPNAPATVTITDPGAIVISRNGQYLYVATDDAIAQFIINGNGTLTANTPATVAATAFNMVTDVNDDFLYYTRFDANVGQFAIAANGTLVPIPGASATVASSGSNWGIAILRK